MGKIAYVTTEIKKTMLRAWVVLRYPDKTVRKQMRKNLIVNAEKKYLRRYLDVLQNEQQKKITGNSPKIIWICWLQGEENMPPIVKKCLQSVRKFCPEYKIIILTDKNIPEFIAFPEYIAERRQAGEMTNTHFSDILRVSLLAEYGGIWIDATVLLTAQLMPEITQTKFFAYHTHSYVKNQSWLLQAEAGNLLMKNMQNLLFAYWKKEHKLIDYFLYHIFFDMMVEHNAECAAMWANVPLIYDDCYELEANYFVPYDEKKWKKIREQTSVHKLSWKYKKEPQKGDFLDALLNGKLEDFGQ